MFCQRMFRQLVPSNLFPFTLIATPFKNWFNNLAELKFVPCKSDGENSQRLQKKMGNNCYLSFEFLGSTSLIHWLVYRATKQKTTADSCRQQNIPFTNAWPIIILSPFIVITRYLSTNNSAFSRVLSKKGKLKKDQGESIIVCIVRKQTDMPGLSNKMVKFTWKV